MKKLLLLLSLLLPACKGTGAQDLALGILTGERAYEVAVQYRECMEREGLNKVDGDSLRRMIDELLFYIATMEGGDPQYEELALELAGRLVAEHDLCIDSDDSKTDAQKADAKRRSQQLLMLVEKLVERVTQPKPAPALDSAPPGV